MGMMMRDLEHLTVASTSMRGRRDRKRPTGTTTDTQRHHAQQFCRLSGCVVVELPFEDNLPLPLRICQLDRVAHKAHKHVLNLCIGLIFSVLPETRNARFVMC